MTNICPQSSLPARKRSIKLSCMLIPVKSYIVHSKIKLYPKRFDDCYLSRNMTKDGSSETKLSKSREFRG